MMVVNLGRSGLLISVFFVAGFISHYERHIKGAIQIIRLTTIDE